MRIVFLVATTLFSIISASAQLAGNPDNWCREGFFTRESEDFKIGFVKSGKGKRSYFYNDLSEKCPEDASCRTKAYVVSGDQLIVSRVRGSFACAWHATSGGSSTVGWVNTDDLEFPATVSDARTNAWVGQWRYGDNSIDLIASRTEAELLNVKGNAIWKGSSDNVHVGELDGRFEHKNGVLRYSDGDSEHDCKATMRLVGGFLVVSDNLKCGGLNVSFSGVYVKKRG